MREWGDVTATAVMVAAVAVDALSDALPVEGLLTLLLAFTLLLLFWCGCCCESDVTTAGLLAVRVARGFFSLASWYVGSALELLREREKRNSFSDLDGSLLGRPAGWCLAGLV